jgi:hypothetical protein
MNRGTHLPNPEQLAGDLLFARLTPPTALATTSWSAVLNSLEVVARASGEISSAADIAQLRSLCGVMDTDAFLPVRVEELTNLEVPRRLVGLADLIRDLSEQAMAMEIADSKGLRTTQGWYWTIPQDRPSWSMAGHRPQQLVALRHQPSLGHLSKHRMGPRPASAGSPEVMALPRLVRARRPRYNPA